MQFKDYLRLRRLAFALKEVRDSDRGILDIAFDYGFSSHEAFTRAFKATYGITPSEYRKKPVPIVLRTKIIPFDRYFLGIGEIGMVKSTEDVKVYFVTIPAHKFLHIKNYESNGYWDFWQKQKNIPGQDCDTISGLLDSIKGKLDDEGGSVANGGSGQLMAYLHDPNGKPFCYGVPRAECYGVRLSHDYNGEIPPQMLMMDVPEAEYIVFEHGPFDYEQENRSVENKMDAAIVNFDFKGTGYCFDDSPGRLTYLFHDPERFWKWVRPVRKSITIKPLTPDLAADYFDFFENRAFTDNPPWGGCYCQNYQMTKAQWKEAFENVDGANMGRAARNVAEKQIKAGALRGYLAYVGNMSIGWCNANEWANYSTDLQNNGGLHLYPHTGKKEKAVVCFEIGPEYRGKGVATALLNRVIADAKAEGCQAVLSFPYVKSERNEWNNRGPMHLYEKAGFAMIGLPEKDGAAVMRLEL